MTGVSPEYIRVGALFEKNGFKPVWFSMGNKKIKIEEIQYSWTERRAGELLYKFTVSDGMALYELHLSARSMRWNLVVLAG